MLYKVALILPPELSKDCCRESRMIAAKYRTHFLLGDEGNVPHVTLIDLDLSMVEMASLLGVVSMVSERCMSLVLEFAFVAQKERYVGYVVRGTQELVSLRLRILQEMTKILRRLCDKGDLYTPHVTISCLQNSIDGEEAVRILSLRPGAFRIARLAVFASGDWGTSGKLVRAFDLIS